MPSPALSHGDLAGMAPQLTIPKRNFGADSRYQEVPREIQTKETRTGPPAQSADLIQLLDPRAIKQPHSFGFTDLCGQAPGGRVDYLNFEDIRRPAGQLGFHNCASSNSPLDVSV